MQGVDMISWSHRLEGIEVEGIDQEAEIYSNIE